MIKIINYAYGLTKNVSINNVVRFKNNRIKIAVPFYKIA